MKRQFYIKNFADYHEINDTKNFKSLELGCFPTDEYSAWRYFGLFYKGRRPAYAKILQMMKKKVSFGEYDFCQYPYVQNFGHSDLEYELKESLGMKVE